MKYNILELVICILIQNNRLKFFLKVFLCASLLGLAHKVSAEKLSHNEYLKYKKKYIKTKSNLDLFNFSNALYLRGKYKLAYKGYRRVVRNKSKLKESAKYYMALCLLKLNKKKSAQKLLQGLLKRKIKPSLRKTVVAKLNQMSPKPHSTETKPSSKEKIYLKRKAFNFFTDVSVGYNSNPELNSENEISFDDNEKDSSDIEYKGALGASYWLVDTLKFDSKLAASLSYITYAEKNELTNMFLSLRAPTSGYLGLYRFKVSPTFGQESDDSSAILSSVGSSFEVARKLKKGLVGFGVNYSLSSPETEDYNYLEGDRFGAYAEYSYRYKKIGVFLYSEYFNNSYIDEVQKESNNGYQFSAKLKYNFTDKLTLETSYRYKVKSYNETDIFYDDGAKTFSLNIAREDVLSQADIAIKYFINKYFDLKLSFSQIENKSTFDSIYTDVGDKNYKLYDGKLNLGFYF